MTDKKKYKYWFAVEESKTVRFSDLAHMMAKAMHPTDEELMDYAAACINLEAELPQAVQNGTLIVRNPAGMGRHTFPMGHALQRAVMLPEIDLEPFLNARGIELRLTPHGSGPDYWTLDNAAAALQDQLNWHDVTRAEFQDQLQQAAATDALVVLDPCTCLPTRSEQVRTYWELVTPESVNIWLENQGAPYRWSVPPPIVTPGLLDPISGAASVGVVSASGGVKPIEAAQAKPLQRTAAQDFTILCEIVKQGYDPLALPKNPHGKPGAKAAIRAALIKNPLFAGSTVFDKAWERLTTRSDIAIRG